MFTGIIEEVGTVRSVTFGSVKGELSVKAALVTEGTKIGDSIAVNGVCLTVTKQASDGFTADVMPETLRRTNLGALHSGDPVDLERAMAADGRFGGHIVSGHIDGTGSIVEQKREGNAVLVRIQTSDEILAGIVEKGSIAIDGISLTVASIRSRDFTVSLIPHTGKATILLSKRPGDTVNLENDIIGKYVRKMLQPAASASRQESGLTLEWLAEHGF